ncbi:MAG: hypothetical protein AB7G37_11155 [Solirubrobacteraceae bacterium]
MPHGDALRPFALEDVAELIDRLGDLSDLDDIVLVGGQALAFWAALVADREPVAARAIGATVDVDFQAPMHRVREVAARLGGEARLPSIDEVTPSTGIVRFVDAHGHPRVLDFIECPFGLTADDVRETSVAVSFPRHGARFWVMHPERCLRSRVCNLDLPTKRGSLAIEQLRAAVAVVHGYGRLLLDEDRPERLVRSMNESVFELAFHDRRADRALLDHGVDVLEALVDDARLNSRHREIRLPQMRRLVVDRRARRADEE